MSGADGDGGRRPAGTARLVELVLDPRDPGFEAAARRRDGTPRRQRVERPLTAFGALVIGFVLALAWVSTHRGAPESTRVHDDLVAKVRSAQSAATALGTAQSDLQARVDRVRADALPDSSALARELARAELIAAQLAAAGPGVTVTLAEPAPASGTPPASDAPGRGSRSVGSGGHILIDRDVRAVVDQLWADGAEAIAVNGIRLTPTSAIRFAGDAILVDYAPISSPYVIEAIGDSDTLVTRFASSPVASRYQTLAGARGIGFGFTQDDALRLAAGPSTRLRYARRADRRSAGETSR